MQECEIVSRRSPNLRQEPRVIIICDHGAEVLNDIVSVVINSLIIIILWVWTPVKLSRSIVQYKKVKFKVAWYGWHHNSIICERIICEPQGLLYNDGIYPSSLLKRDHGRATRQEHINKETWRLHDPSWPLST